MGSVGYMNQFNTLTQRLLQMANTTPYITVSVEYNGDTVKQYCTHFIDAIGFLCQAEASIRRNSNLKEPVDNRTSITQKEILTRP